MTIDVRDLRSSERFVVREALTGTYGGVEVTIGNLCEQGAMITHLNPMRIGTRARLIFRRGAIVTSVQARIVWSHLENQVKGGTLVYRSGLLVEPDATYQGVLGELVQEQVVQVDAGTLERKREKLAARERQKTGPGNIKVPVVTDNAPDPTLLVRHALTKVKADPHELHRLYLRGRVAAEDYVIDGEPEEVIAVWEYLGRVIELPAIDRALRRRA